MVKKATRVLMPNHSKNLLASKRSQTTMFIIAAILIVSVISLFFLLRGKGVEIFRPSISEPQQYIEKCAKDSASKAISIMLPQAGYISPQNYKLYQDNKVAYLCYNVNYYYPCINQEPLYIQHLEEEIKTYIQPKIEDCFYALEQEYQKKKYQVDSGLLSLDVELRSKQVNIDIEKKLALSKGEESRKYDKFEAKLNSPLYDLSIVAQEIASQEAKFCNFEYLGYSLLYPQFSIEKKQVGSESTASKIYTIKDKISGKELLIAIRSCAMPGGL